MESLSIFGVVKNASTVRPWQVLEVAEWGCSIHGSFKTRQSALGAANGLNGSRSSTVIESLQEVDELLSHGTVLGDFSRIAQRFEQGLKR